MNEIDLLRDGFGADEVPPDGARDRARTALLERIHHTGATPVPARSRRRRWPLQLRLAAAGAAMAAAAVVAVVVVENLGTVDADGTSHPAVAGLPFAHPASAAEYLENAAWAATRKPWKKPRPDQFMYKEIRVLTNDPELRERSPNGPLVPGRSRVVTEQHWNRIDTPVM